MPERVSEDLLSLLERLDRLATAPPWKAERVGASEVEIGAETPRGHLSVAWVHLGERPTAKDVTEALADAELVAAARNALPGLIAAVRSLLGEG